MSSRLNNSSLLMSSITYFIILWRKPKSRKTLFENSTLWSRFIMQIPQWLSSICFITKRYELWHVISLEKLQAEALVYKHKSQRSHPLRLCTSLETCTLWGRHSNLPKGQKSGEIKLRGHRNLKIHLCFVLKLGNRDSDNRKRFNRENRKFDEADVDEGRTGNLVFWHWSKIIFACQTCTKVTFYHPNRTWNNRVFRFLAAGY